MITVSAVRFLRMLDDSGIDYFVEWDGRVTFCGTRRALAFVTAEIKQLSALDRADVRDTLELRDRDLSRRLVAVLGRVV